MCDIFGMKKAAKRQAAATLKAAEDQAAADRIAAEAVQRSRETMIAQSVAADRAKELLDVPMEEVDVDLSLAPAADVDTSTGRRRPTRAKFMSNPQGSAGLRI